jgi:hypothetical protein
LVLNPGSLPGSAVLHHRHIATMSRPAFRAPRATGFQSRLRVAVRAPTESLYPLLGLRPRQRGFEGSDGGEEPVGRRQRDLVDQILRGGDGTRVEGGDPAGESIDETIQFGVWNCPIDVSVLLRSVAIEVVPAQNDFERSAAADQMWKTFRAAAAGMQSHCDLGLAQSRVLARSKTHVASENELAAHASDTASDLRDANHWGLGETHERIHKDREARRPDSCPDVSYLAGQIKVGKVELRIRALEYDNAQTRAGTDSREQIL